MSTRFSQGFGCRLAMLVNIVALLIFGKVCTAAPQVSVRIHLVPENSRVEIDGTCPATAKWSFPDSYGGVLGLGNRVENFAVFEESGTEIPTRKLAPGQFDSARAASHFRYEVNLTPRLSSGDLARVSWLTRQRGLLMLADLLPIISVANIGATSAAVRFQVPESWTVQSNDGENQSAVEVPDIDRAVFALGMNLRTSRITESGMSFRLVTDGEWAFADVEVSEMVARILKADRGVFGSMPAKQGTLILFPFPGSAAASQWSAETRGATVTLLMGKLPSKIAALAQISTPLTHELFHLWVPNGLALEGNYDWFYEGFTVYQAARTAVRLDLLTFQEFLNAMGRAYDGSNIQQTNSVSLIESSTRRWTTGQSAVYSKSMVVAFVYDLRVRSASHGKKSLDNVYRLILQKYSSAAAAKSNGNEAAIQAMAVDGPAENFVREFIRNPVSINLGNELVPFGLEVETVGLRTRIRVSEKLNKQQRDLLRELGYNDAVRSPRK